MMSSPCLPSSSYVSPVLHRSVKDAVVPLSEPIKGVDGKMIHELVIPKDTTVCIGVLSSNTTKTIWGEDAMEWKPERWLSPLPAALEDARIPGIYSHLWVQSSMSLR